MRILHLAPLVLIVSACTAPGHPPQPTALAGAGPPVAARKPYLVESPNGARMDEYYWLRDDKRESPEVLAYLNAENAWRDTAMAHTSALQEQLYAELTGRLDPDESTVPVYDRGYWYYTRFAPGQEYPVYARRKGSLDAPEQVMLDGNRMAAGHPFFRIGATAVSDDGRLLAWTDDTVGRRQYVLRVKDLGTGTTLPDAVTNVEAEFAWAADNRTLLYAAKDPVTLLAERVHRHTLGTDPATDALIYREDDPSFYLGIGRSRSRKYLFIELSSTDQSEWRYADAADPELRFRPVLPREPKLEYTVDHLGADFILRTNWQAPNFRIVRAPIATSTDKRTWRDVLPHRADALLEDFEVATSHLAVNERSGGLLKIRVLPWAPPVGAPSGATPVPRESRPRVSSGTGVAPEGAPTGVPGRLIDAREPAYTMRLVPTPGIDSPTIRYTYSSLIDPEAVYDHDLPSGRSELRKVDKVLGGFATANYATAFIRAPARDGRQVPVSIAWRKGTRLDGTAPLFVYGYGSYGLSEDPAFSSDWVSLLDRGFVVAIAHVRGGQELGREWYEDGRQLRKKNTFTDFIDATRHLVREGYGAKDKVFAEGGSAGGLLMGAVANMAPGDYRGIIAHVPFVDVVTTMLDESIPLTTNEFDEWGNPKEKAFYDYMLSYSPYDNVAAQDYPAMLVFTGLWDSQVQYYEPAKWVARLRARKTDGNPLVFSVDMSAGHSGRAGRYQRYRDTALEYAFILDQLAPGP
ncbi:MAG: S9 family peptidase [Chromatiales bacterium]|nr:S9 family peptidase [Chromatiales bacterium]